MWVTVVSVDKTGSKRASQESHIHLQQPTLAVTSLTQQESKPSLKDNNLQYSYIRKQALW